jgi:hypothetical protein
LFVLETRESPSDSLAALLGALGNPNLLNVIPSADIGVMSPDTTGSPWTAPVVAGTGPEEENAADLSTFAALSNAASTPPTWNEWSSADAIGSSTNTVSPGAPNLEWDAFASTSSAGDGAFPGGFISSADPISRSAEILGGVFVGPGTAVTSSMAPDNQAGAYGQMTASQVSSLDIASINRSIGPVPPTTQATPLANNNNAATATSMIGAGSSPIAGKGGPIGNSGFTGAMSPQPSGNTGDGGDTCTNPDPYSIVSVTAMPDVREGDAPADVYLTRTGDISLPLDVSVLVSSDGASYNITAAIQTQVLWHFDAGQSTIHAHLTAVHDGKFEGPKKVVLTIEPDANCYSIGIPQAVVRVADIDAPPHYAPDCGCAGGGELVGTPSGAEGNVPMETSEGSDVRFADGARDPGFTLGKADSSTGRGFSEGGVDSNGFGTPWGFTGDWTSDPGFAPTGPQGTGWMVTQLPRVITDANGVVIMLSNATTARWFVPSGGVYVPMNFGQETLTYDGANKEFKLVDDTGQIFRFWNFDFSLPVLQRGQLKSFTDKFGHVFTVTAYSPDGLPAEIQRSDTTGGTTNVESYLITWINSGALAFLASNVTLRRQVNGGAWNTVRQIDFGYYDGSQAHGNVRDLMYAALKDGAGNVLDTNYFRYYVPNETNGYAHGLKYFFGSDAYGRMAGALGDPTLASDAAVAPYADGYFEYDPTQRVTKAVIRGAGNSGSAGGLGTFTYQYTTSYFFDDGPNSWWEKAVETRPDGTQETVYTNAAGEPMLDVVTSGTQSWADFYQYDASGRVLLHAHPSAVTGWDETSPDLLVYRPGPPPATPS